ncbi:MAG: MBL fold metallo-hydrolase [Deltaproteobacteria bacterium]|nr:MBL fold metallo-hydrolase [Deltaproteobacteria bacterium]
MEILPGIHCLPVTIQTLPPHRSTNMYVILHGDSAVVVDAVSPLNNEPQEQLAQLGVKSIQRAVITHAHGDHYMGLEAFLEKFGGKIGCTPKTHQRLEDTFKAEDFGTDLKDGEILELGDFRIKALSLYARTFLRSCLPLPGE